MWRRARELRAGQWWLLLRAFALLLGAKGALAFLPVRRVIAWKQRAVPAGSLSEEGKEMRRSEVRWAVLTVARRSPVQFVCFPQCLAASALLRASGLGSRLHYGVRRGTEAARLETHTWLEAGGEIVIGGEVAPEFSTLEIY